MNKFLMVAVIGLSSLFACGTNSELTVDVTFEIAQPRSSSMIEPALSQGQGCYFFETEGITRTGKSFKALIFSPLNTSWGGFAARVKVRTVYVHGVLALVGTVTKSSPQVTATNFSSAGIILVAKNSKLTRTLSTSKQSLNDQLITSLERPIGKTRFIQFNNPDGTPFVAGVGTLKLPNTVSSVGLFSSPIGTKVASNGWLSGQIQTINTIIGSVGWVTGTLTPLDGNPQGINAVLIGL
jgi:hypothetical protein